MNPFNSHDPGFTVSWLFGLPALQSLPSWTGVFNTKDSASLATELAKSVMVGQSEQPHWAASYETSDAWFSVTWLLGLESDTAQPSAPPEWAGMYETTDSAFSVSALLGLAPWPTATSTLEAVPTTDNPVEAMKDADGKEQIPESSKSEEPAAEDQPSDEKQEEKNAAFVDLASSLELILEDIDRSQKTNLDDFDKESIDGLSPEDCDDDDPSRLEWLRQKRVEYAQNRYMDRIMSLPGLTEAKAFMLDAKAKIQAANRRETQFKKINLDVIFSGNPGTGKTLVSQLYARYLRSMGVVKANEQANLDGIYVASGWILGTDGIDGTLDKIEENANSCGGCIVIIEDAHHMADRVWNLWRLYRATMRLPGNIVYVINNEWETELRAILSANAQLRTELRIVKFKDMTKEDLRSAFSGLLRTSFGKRMELEGGLTGLPMEVLLKRVLRIPKGKWSNNMWTLKEAFHEAAKRQVERFRRARHQGEYLDDWLMTSGDLLGVKPDLTPEKSSAWKEMQQLTGIEAVKEEILAVVHQVNENHKREVRGDEMLPISPNRVFMGPPGTGKTTVAKLYAKLLAEFGIVSKGEVVHKKGSDLVGTYIGWSEDRTKQALEDARGGILIIDDAHMLDPGKQSSGDKDGNFRGAVLDTLVAEMSSEPGEDRCVILCGYEDPMKEMFQNGNPGLGRRFPLDQAFKFPGFSQTALGEILDSKAKKQKVEMTDKARDVAMEMLKRASVRPNFGNAGELDNLLTKGVIARTKRLVDATKTSESDLDLSNFLIEPQDFDADWERPKQSVAATRELFKDLIGFEEIVNKFESLQYVAQGMRLRGIDPRPYIPFTFVFKGPPGTGKTTTARKLGTIFYDMGFLAAPDVVEVSASDLIGEFLGQTGPKTARLLESALGKVLFIDEAYRLARDGKYGDEAVSEIVDAVTKEKFSRKMIIVLAGYEEDMNRLMRVNHGLRSRFATELTFKPMRGEQTLHKIRQYVAKVGIEIPQTATMDSVTRDDLLGSLGRLAKEKEWASGRSAETLGDRVIAYVFKECAIKGYTGKELVVTGKDLLNILNLGVLKNGVSLRAHGPSTFGASQVRTLKDLGEY